MSGTASARTCRHDVPWKGTHDHNEACVRCVDEQRAYAAAGRSIGGRMAKEYRAGMHESPESGGLERRKGPHKQNLKVSGRARAKGEQEFAQMWHCPPGVRLALSRPDLYKGFFTPFEWQVLRARWWHGRGPQTSSVMVGRALKLTGQSAKIRKAQHQAYETASKLWDWYRYSNPKWHRIKRLRAAGMTKGKWDAAYAKKGIEYPWPALDDFDREILRWYKSASRKPKKGRRAQKPVTGIEAPKYPFRFIKDFDQAARWLDGETEEEPEIDDGE